MTEESSAKLKSKRTILRSTVTKYCNKIETSLKESNENLDLNELEECLEQLIKKADELKIADSEIEQYLKPEDYDREFQSIEDYNEKITKWEFRAKKRINEINPTPISNPSAPVHRRDSDQNQSTREAVNIKLPKLSIPMFYGDSSQWLNFWNSFESAIHNNDSLSKIDKFNYLRAHLGSIAASTIEGFSLSNQNYDIVIALLTERFGKRDILINSHLNNLLNIPPLRNSNDLIRFRTIVDKCQTQIRSLESLGVVSSTYGSILCPILLKLLPSDLVLAFNKIESPDTNFNINNLMEFLSRELCAREKTNFFSRQKTDESFHPPADSAKEKVTRNKSQIATAADLFCNAEVIENKLNCAFCNKAHRSTDCNYAMKLSFEEKRLILKRGGYCFRCLFRSHLARDCRRKVVCSSCGRNDHVDIMCNCMKSKFNRFVKNDSLNENFRTDVNDSENSEVRVDLNNQSSFNEVYLQTLIVCVKGANREYQLRTIIDTGSQNSYISKYAAKMLKLKSLKEVEINHGLFGGTQVSEKHNCYKITLSNIDKSYDCEITVLDQKEICSLIPKIENTECIRKLKNMGIYVSDIFEREASRLFERNPQEIHLLLGADTCANLFTGVMEPLPWKSLVALRTKLGWTVMGKAASDRNYQRNSLSALSLSLHVSSCKISDLHHIDILGIMEDKENKSKNNLEDEAMRHFSDTVKRDEEGRFEVSLPWALDKNIFSNNLNLAKKCSNKIKTNIVNSALKEGFEQILYEWETNGIFECIDAKEPTNEKVAHGLPFQPVFKETSETTKIRPVFNASARMKSSPSLNDNCQITMNSIEEMNKFIEDSQKILLSGQFNLRCWQSNFPNEAMYEPAPNSVSVLGMWWNLRDDELPSSLINSFRSWFQKLPALAQVHIPRWLYIDKINESKVTLHVFNDASKCAYATCAYLRSENTPGTKVQLVSARSRVAPLKPMTIPRLELLSCVIGARLASTIRSDLKLPNLKIILWSDSSIELTWIRSDEQWKTFVHNRIKEIRVPTESSAWKYVPRKSNPTDRPSRGCLADQLLKSEWWEGPEWLKRHPHDWPQGEARANMEIIKEEKIVLDKVQSQDLKENKKNIQTFMGSDGLLRVKTEISQRKDLENFKYPILLSDEIKKMKKLITDIYLLTVSLLTVLCFIYILDIIYCITMNCSVAPKPENRAMSSIFISDISYISEEILKALISELCQVLSFWLISDKSPNKFKISFCEYKDPENALRFNYSLSGYELKGEMLELAKQTKMCIEITSSLQFVITKSSDILSITSSTIDYENSSGATQNPNSLSLGPCLQLKGGSMSRTVQELLVKLYKHLLTFFLEHLISFTTLLFCEFATDFALELSCGFVATLWGRKNVNRTSEKCCDHE